MPTTLAGHQPAKRLPVDVAPPKVGETRAAVHTGMRATLKANLCHPEEG